MRQLPLIGRDSELATIREILAGRVEQSGVVISGPAGVGKTRLAEEAAVGIDRRSVLTLIGTPAAQGVPLAPLLAAFPDLNAAPQRGIAEIRARLVAQRKRPTLIVDDAQWLDPATQTLLHLLVIAREGHLIATVRDDLPVPVTLVNLGKNGHLGWVDLRPLPSAESAAFVAGLVGAPVEAAVLAQLLRRSRGLPLALRELTAHALATGALTIHDGLARAAGPLPRSRQLGEVIISNLELVHPSSRRVLDVVAVAEPIPLELLVRVVDDGDLTAAEAAGLIRLTTSKLAAGPVVTVGHPLYGEAAVAALTVLHRHRVLEHLIDAAQSLARTSEALTLRLAAWCLEIGRPAPIEALIAAIRFTHRAIDADQAAAHSAALWRARPAFETGVLYAEALVRQQRHALADDVLRRVKNLTLTEAQRVSRASLANEVLARLGRHDDAIAELREAEDATSDASARAHLTVRRAFTTGLSGRTRQGLAIILPLVRDGGPDELREAVMFTPGMLALDGRAQDALDLVARAEQLDRDDSGSPPDYLRQPAQTLEMPRTLALLHAGRLVEAAASARDGIRHAEETGLDYLLAGWLNLSGRIEMDAGHPATAVLRFGRVLAETPHVSGGAQRAIALTALIEAYAVLGQVRQAEEALAALAENPGNTPWHPAGLAELSRGYLAAAKGLAGPARDLFQEACARAAPANASVALVAAHAIARYGQPEVGLARAREMPEVQGPLAPLRMAHMVALVAGDTAGLIEIATGFAQLGADLLAAEAYGAAADLGARRADTRTTTLARRAGNALAPRIEGARTPGLAGLADLGGPALTRRELEIATSAARGLSSRAIADRLALSVRTVDNNLQSVYRKLGVRSRQGLTDALAPPGPASPDRSG